jgi:hypothetical protein
MRKTLDDAAVKRILDRAVELDAERSGSLEPDQVHSIAAELGISREAVDVALAEYQDTLTAVPAGRGITRRSLIVGGAVATIALLGALVFGIGRTAPAPLPTPAPEAPPAPPVVVTPVPPVPPTPPAQTARP